MVVQTADPVCGLFRTVQRRQEHGRENRNDRDHDQEFDQRKAAGRFTLQAGGILAAKPILAADL